VPLVFVHGVNVRKGAAYETTVARRDAMFRRFLGARITQGKQPLSLFNPYWGDEAARFYWNHASLLSDAHESLGQVGTALAESLASEEVLRSNLGREPLLSIASKIGLQAAIDFLWECSADVGRRDDSDQFAILGELALAYAQSNPSPDWLLNATSDQRFLQLLKTAIESGQPGADPLAEGVTREKLGSAGQVWDDLHETLDRVSSAIPSVLSRSALSIIRPAVNRTLGTFLGDVFVYLHQRDTLGANSPILKLILDAVDTGDRMRSETREPLVVIAHSMGGNIVYDILTWMRPSLRVDVLVTVGTQIALFEELKLFSVSDKGIPSADAPRVSLPAGVRKWLNIFEINDVLSFPAGKIFQGVEDCEYSTGKSLLTAHTAYFNRPSFHRRLADRIAGEAA